MANVTKTADFEVNGIEAFGLWADPIVNAPNMPWMGWTRRTNITYRKQKLIYHDHLGDILQFNNSCGFDPSDSFNIYERYIETTALKVNLELCAKDFDCTLIEPLLGTGVDKANQVGGAVANIIIQQQRMATMRDLYKTSWFGVKGAARSYASRFDGIWTKVKELVNETTPEDGYIPYVDAGSGSPLQAGDVLTLLKNVMDNQTNTLFEAMPNEKVLYVSRSVYEALQYEYTIQNGCCTDLALENIQGGVPTLRYMGVEVKVVTMWDVFFNQEGLQDQHYVMLTLPNNLILGTNQEQDLNRIEVWYDQREQTNCFRAEFEFGVDFFHPELFSVAY